MKLDELRRIFDPEQRRAGLDRWKSECGVRGGAQPAATAVSGDGRPQHGGKSEQAWEADKAASPRGELGETVRRQPDSRERPANMLTRSEAAARAVELGIVERAEAFSQLASAAKRLEGGTIGIKTVADLVVQGTRDHYGIPVRLASVERSSEYVTVELSLLDVPFFGPPYVVPDKDYPPSKHQWNFDELRGEWIAKVRVGWGWIESRLGGLG